MSKKVPQKTKVKVEAKEAGREKYILRLFVTGILPNSARAIVNIRAICDKYLTGRYELEIIDIYQQPSLAISEEIVAIPLLIKKSPLPEVRMIGDLSNLENVLKGLDLV
ncbi:MAG: circadian clock KaiB family protein [Bacteroidota bacterium]|nr:circadian clock KaiB family protein [Bacteroidota bacterium]